MQSNPALLDYNSLFQRIIGVEQYSLERLLLKLKFQYFGHLMQSWLFGKDPDVGKDWRQKEKGEAEDEMVR